MAWKAISQDSASVSKRKFLRQIGTSSVALSTLGVVTTGAKNPSPEAFCNTRTLVDDGGAASTCVKRTGQDEFDEITARLRLEHVNSNEAGSIGDFFTLNASTASCDPVDMDHHDYIYPDSGTIEVTYTSPSPYISILVEDNSEYGLTYDIELEQCTY